VYPVPPLVETVRLVVGMLKVGAAPGRRPSDANAIAELLGLTAVDSDVPPDTTAVGENPAQPAAGTLCLAACWAHLAAKPLGSTLFKGSLPT
jgi:hypothetical protein